ncbi:ATP-binding protein [Streptomyces sp. NPDC090025]|uniref:ATP-binding protein n=1 Tax=Streptomyces sp. NPDC090025 TaxID=3365922 RepID=UPI00383605C2
MNSRNTAAAVAVRTPAEARSSVRRAVSWTSPEVDDLLLVTSELVTNAVRHGGGVTGFALDVGRGSVTVAVSDASRRPPRRREDGGFDRGPGGYGWPIVLRLAREVSVEVGPRGKTVRAVVALERGAATVTGAVAGAGPGGGAAG